jgi:hypothetical protein
LFKFLKISSPWLLRKRVKVIEVSNAINLSIKNSTIPFIKKLIDVGLIIEFLVNASYNGPKMA